MEIQSELLEAAEDGTGTISGELSTGVPVGSELKTTSALNLRTGAGTGYGVRLVIPQGGLVTTINLSAPVSGWYNVKYNGVSGWSYGGYLTLVAPSAGTGDPAGVIARARSGVGFSYYWGHGSWLPDGASSNYGSCSGSCPSCSHAGRYGADCSGYLAKVWQVPASNSDLSADAHPYSTVSFNGSSSQWTTVARGSALAGDALVYNADGAGHIFLFEAGDGWGSLWAYEARGCSYGIAHNLRTASSAYKAIRKN